MTLEYAGANGLRGTVVGVEIQSAATMPSVETTIVRTSGAAWRFAAGAAKAASWIGYYSGAADRYYRIYFQLVALPTSTNSFVYVGNSATPQIEIRCTSGGVLSFWNNEDATQIGSNSSAISTGTWYRLEFQVDDTTLSATVAEARLYAASDESNLLWNPSGTANLALAPNRFFVRTTDTTEDLVWTDVVIIRNDGTAPTTWAGEGSIGYLRPDGDSGTPQWTRGGTDSGANWSQNDETPPNDITDYVQSNTSGQIDDYTLLATPSGVLSTDTINWVAVGARQRVSSTTGGEPEFVTRLTVGGNTSESGGIIGAGSTSWSSYAAANVLRQTHVMTVKPTAGTPFTKSDLDATTIGIRETVSDTHFAQVSSLWLMFDHKPTPSTDQFQPEHTVIDETYDVEHDYSGFVAWQMPDDVHAIAGQYYYPDVDDTYEPRGYRFDGWLQSPMRDDFIPVQLGLVETPFIDDTYDLPYDYQGLTQSPRPSDVFIAIPQPENTQIDETYDVEYDYTGFVQSPLSENVEDFQPLPEFPVIDETYEQEHNYDGFAIWQTPSDIVEPPPFYETPAVDEAYDYVYEYFGFTQSPRPENVEDFQALPEFAQIDETYDQEYDYSGFVSWQMPDDVVATEPLPLLETSPIDETYFQSHSYKGWQQSPARADVEPPTPTVYPVVDELYDLFFGHNFDGLVSYPIGNRPDVLVQLLSHLVGVQIPVGGDVLLKPTTGKVRVIKTPTADVKTDDVLTLGE